MVSPEPKTLNAERLIADGGIPARARADALHVAVAAVHGIDYLLTWNCRHINNAAVKPALRKRATLPATDAPRSVHPWSCLGEASPMYEDEVIREVWRIRDAYVSEHNHDLSRMVADLEARQRRLRRPLVDRRQPHAGTGKADLATKSREEPKPPTK